LASRVARFSRRAGSRYFVSLEAVCAILDNAAELLKGIRQKGARRTGRTGGRTSTRGHLNCVQRPSRQMRHSRCCAPRARDVANDAIAAGFGGPGPDPRAVSPTRPLQLLIPTVAGFEAAREYLFRTVAQITLNYRGGPLSVGTAGQVHGGDRLPWVPVNGQDNFASLAAMTWQVHVYGSATEELAHWCAAHDLPLHVFDWRSQYETAGILRNALYLLRQDSYVSLADPSGSVQVLERYALERGGHGKRIKA
jgi:hypothetical protein